jgi:hypothetical protein
MTVEAFVFLKSERGNGRKVLEYVARSRSGKVGWDQKFAEAGVKGVFRTSGEFDVIIQVSRASRREIYQLVRSIKKHVKVRRHKIVYFHPKMVGDP